MNGVSEKKGGAELSPDVRQLVDAWLSLDRVRREIIDIL